MCLHETVGLHETECTGGAMCVCMGGACTLHPASHCNTIFIEMKIIILYITFRLIPNINSIYTLI